VGSEMCIRDSSNRADDILNSRLIETACVKSTRLTHVEGDKKDPVEPEAYSLYTGRLCFHCFIRNG